MKLSLGKFLMQHSQKCSNPRLWHILKEINGVDKESSIARCCELHLPGPYTRGVLQVVKHSHTHEELVVKDYTEVSFFLEGGN